MPGHHRFVASLASVGGVFLDNHLFHEVGLIIAIGFALVTLVSGVLSHGYIMNFAVGSLGLGMMAGALSRPHDGTECLGLSEPAIMQWLDREKTKRVCQSCNRFNTARWFADGSASTPKSE